MEQQGGGFVSYGSAGGSPRGRAPARGMQRAADRHVRQQVSLSLFTDFENFSTFRPAAAIHDDAAAVMFDQLEAWAGALKPLRKEPAR